MPDNVELKKNRLIKKKDKDNDVEEDSDEEMLQLLQRQVEREALRVLQNLLFAILNYS